MGLANKLAASQGGQQPGGQGGYPGQQSYQPYPGGAGAPQQGQPQYGAPPPGGQYGGAPPAQAQAHPADATAFRNLLHACIEEKKLQAFYPPGSPVIDQIAQKAPQLISQLMSKWRIGKEVAYDVVKLALYDIVLYIDDSGSMQFEEEGSRIQDLRVVLDRTAYAATLFDADGISIRFMNTNLPSNLQDHVATEAQIEQLMRGVKFSGLTPMGASLKQKILDSILMPQVQNRQLRKPMLVITITDGQPAGETAHTLENAIVSTFQALRNSQYGQGALAFEFAQVGNDEAARKFLNKLDEDPLIGPFIDCTSNFEQEQAEMMKANPPVDLTPDMWVIKLLLGAIDSSYDTKDEKKNRQAGAPGGYGAPGGGYGQPPPGQYQQPGQPGPYQQPGQYGQQYGQPSYPGQGPPGHPPQQMQYGQQQFPGQQQQFPGQQRPPQPGYPPQGYPPQGQGRY